MFRQNYVLAKYVLAKTKTYVLAKIIENNMYERNNSFQLLQIIYFMIVYNVQS